MAYAPYLIRQYNYQQLKTASIDAVLDPAKVDVELNTIIAAFNALCTRERAYTTPSGGLSQAPVASSLSLLSSTRFVATTNQTAFVVPAYTVAYDTVEVWTGSGSAGLTMVDPNSVVKTDATHVTLPAQPGGQIVVILIFSNGSSTLATLAIDGTSGGTSGATLIGFLGSGLFLSHTVEGALVEFRTAYNAFVVALGALGNVLRADGSVPLAANLPAGGHKLTGLAAGTVAGDSVEFSQFNTFAAVWNNLQGYYAKLDGTTPWTGDWNAGAHKLTNLANGVNAQDALTVAQFNLGATQSGKNACVNGSCMVAQGEDYAATVSGTYGYGSVDMIIGALTAGTSVLGTLTQGSPGPGTGSSARWSNVTLVGTGGVALQRLYIESWSARRFINNQLFFGVNVKHNSVGNVNVIVNVYTANATDNFSGGMTLIGTSTTSVAPNVDTRISMTPLAGGIAAAGSGICIEVAFAVGACAARNFETSAWQAETGSYSAFEYLDYSTQLAKCKRYYEKIGGDIATQDLAVGQCIGTSTAYFFRAFEVKKRATPTITRFGTVGDIKVSKADGTTQALSVVNTPGSSAGGISFTVTTAAATLVVGNATFMETTQLTAYFSADARLT